MMPDATNPVRITDVDGKTVATFTGHDLQAWRQFQLDAIKNLNIVVTDSSMPVEISKTIKGPDKRDDKFVASG